MTAPLFQIPLLPARAATLLLGEDLFNVTLAELERARHRVWASMFIVAMGITSDPTLRVREVIDALARAARRGVDTRLLIDDFDDQDFPVNLVAAHYLVERGVSVRRWRDEKRVSNHSKFLVFDAERVLVSSGNWSTGGLCANLEASLLVDSGALNEQLATRFAWAWDEAATVEELP
jgi:phosphatidylserine/phosphatidylglycerophosphate/cardiolipin synthase-like enzyme